MRDLFCFVIGGFFALGLIVQAEIPESSLVVELVDVATVPDSSSGNAAPPRLSVLTQDSKGRLFVNDQRGPLYYIDEGLGTVTEYLDLRDFGELSLLSTFEAGFQSFAFHPEFHNEGANGYGKFYTIFSSNSKSVTPDFNPGGSNSFHTLLLEWTALDASSTMFTPADMLNPYRVVMRLQQPYGNHNSGLVAFNGSIPESDADYGNLYLAVGDGGSGGDPLKNGQDLSNPYGAILRIDPLGNDSANGAYGIVSENVFAGDGDAETLGEIYCFGLRNPQRFGWDVVTGQMFIADIGQDLFEEVNEGGNGVNFGWDVREGGQNVDGSGTGSMVDPVAAYNHGSDISGTTGSRAITAGEVARGTCVVGLDGNLILSDFPNGVMMLLDVDHDPLNGGNDGLRELVFTDGAGGDFRYLEKINEVRSARGLGNSSRADLRFGVNTPGRVFLINKHDGIVRRLKVNELPMIDVEKMASGIGIPFNGVLQTSAGLGVWTDLIPQPRSGDEVEFGVNGRFYRAVRR